MSVSEKNTIQQVSELLSAWLKVPKNEMHIEYGRDNVQIDGLIYCDNAKFLIASKTNSSAAQIIPAIQALQKSEINFQGFVIPLLVVPFMGEVGRKLCEEADVSWLDLSGNANIFAPGMRILIDGRPNRFKSPGRPANAFAPKSARIARWLLIHANRPMNQREIALATDMDEGFTSRIVSRLEKDGLIVRNINGLIRISNPNLLLDAWQERYVFSKHQIIKGHIAARTSDELLKKVPDLFLRNKVPQAATGLGAAWLYTKFSGFRIVSFYLKFRPSAEIFDFIGFREDPRGANIWFVIPNDEGVFQGSEEVQGIRCVHPVQVYLDLLGHPERAKEAAEHLRQELLNWNKDA